LNKPLPYVICTHRSLIRRKLGNTDPELQENKAVNLALAAPKVSGVLIRPGETFSFWRLVGRVDAAKGYREGLTVTGKGPSRGIGGGMCQFTNLIHWMVLHTPLEIVEKHHHAQDLFPDYRRQTPFGTGTSIVYNYRDYRFRNPTNETYQLIVYTDDTYLNGEIRATAPLPYKVHLHTRDECFVREGDGVYRCGDVVRTVNDKRTGDVLREEVIQRNHARVMYDTSELTIVE
jgi:vancomycin resistance protein VanW